MTNVYDLDSGTRVWGTEGDRAAGAIDFFGQLGELVTQGIASVAMDMWKPFEKAVC